MNSIELILYFRIDAFLGPPGSSGLPVFCSGFCQPPRPLAEGLPPGLCQDAWRARLLRAWNADGARLVIGLTKKQISDNWRPRQTGCKIILSKRLALRKACEVRGWALTCAIFKEEFYSGWLQLTANAVLRPTGAATKSPGLECAAAFRSSGLPVFDARVSAMCSENLFYIAFYSLL